jgi:hypothetical protein
VIKGRYHGDDIRLRFNDCTLCGLPNGWARSFHVLFPHLAVA